MVRTPMQVDKGFHDRIKNIQKTVMQRQGKFKGIPTITKDIIDTPEWGIIEKKLTGNVATLNFKINFDGRKR